MMKFRYLLGLLFLFPGLSAGCQNKIGEITPDYIGRQFVAAINTADPADWEAIARVVHSPASVEKNGMDRLVAMFQRMHGNYAPMEYHHAEQLVFPKPDGDSYILHVYARKQGEVMWSDFQFRLDPSPPHLISNLVFVAEVAEPIALPNGSIEQQETLDWLNGYIEKMERENDLSGCILIARGGRVLFEKYWGLADIESGRKINAGTLFGMASGSKMFTAIAIMQLQEQGKLKLSDPLTKYFPDFPHKEWAGRTTLQHLLSHTSGIAEYWTKENEPAMLAFDDWHQFLPLIYKEGFQFEPGTESGYSNSNYMLLGAIVEKTSGQDYYTYMEEHILKKAGMSQSGWFNFSDEKLPLAVPYARDGKGGWTAAKHFKKGSPAGGCYSNPADMWQFLKALKTNQLISAASLKDMTTDKTAGVKDAQPYGLGFILEQHAQEPTFGHGGITGGVNFEFRYFPQQDILLVVFNNQNNGAYDDLKRNTVKLISGER
ncbi:MAG: serine hydrolase domain-containing protein [Saprospiraceae bacterium]